MPVPVLSAAEAEAWDAAARDVHGIPSRVLMDAAGRAAAHTIATAAPESDGPASPSSALIACGPGNNGGDGWVVARALHAAGWRVWATDPDKERTTDCEANRVLALADGVEWVAPDGAWPQVGVMVDALLGTGASGIPRGPVSALAERVATSGVPIVAIDGPTGLDLTTGEAHGPVRASLTVTFGGARRGHLIARDWCGDLVIVDIGFPPPQATVPELVTDRWVASHLPPLDNTMHKGARGRILVIGGAEGMAGAAIHAARAAFAAGAGLVKVAVPAASTAAVQANVPDALTTTLDRLPESIGWADAIVLGPGLGRGEAETALVRSVLETARIPLVVDADALHVPGVATLGTAPRVLTPHAGEFASQFPHITLDDRFAAATAAVAPVSPDAPVAPPVALLFKGVPTIIAAAGTPTRVVARGNVGLATGGSGDVLAGLIGLLLARGLPPDVAAAVGAHVLGRAAEIAADVTPVRAMRPEDVTSALPDVWRALADLPRRVPPVIEVLPAPVTA